MVQLGRMKEDGGASGSDESFDPDQAGSDGEPTEKSFDPDHDDGARTRAQKDTRTHARTATTSRAHPHPLLHAAGVRPFRGHTPCATCTRTCMCTCMQAQKSRTQNVFNTKHKSLPWEPHRPRPHMLRPAYVPKPQSIKPEN